MEPKYALRQDRMKVMLWMLPSMWRLMLSFAAVGVFATLDGRVKVVE